MKAQKRIDGAVKLVTGLGLAVAGGCMLLATPLAAVFALPLMGLAGWRMAAGLGQVIGDE